MIRIKQYVVRILKRYIYDYRSNKLLIHFSKILKNNALVLIDIGAAGEIQPRWRQITPLLNYIGFEPDERSYKEIKDKETSCNTYKIYNSAVWSYDGKLPINFCRKPMVSSYFKPNREFVDRYADSDRFDILSSEEVNITRLDNFDIEYADFMKLDIQGGELEALKGGEKLLSNCLGLEVEVEFLKMYESQPLFGDICKFLDAHGFEFIDFTSIDRWERKKPGFGQSVFADALFLKSPEKLFEKNASNHDLINRYVAICAIYGRFDLIDELKLNSEEFESTQKALIPLRKKHKKVKARALLINKFLSFFGGRYFFHLLH